MINISLLKPLSKDFITPDNIQCDYQFPELRVTVQKENIASVLSYMLKKVEFSDVTIEDEPIEDIIKKIFIEKK